MCFSFHSTHSQQPFSFSLSLSPSISLLTAASATTDQQPSMHRRQAVVQPPPSPPEPPQQRQQQQVFISSGSTRLMARKATRTDWEYSGSQGDRMLAVLVDLSTSCQAQHQKDHNLTLRTCHYDSKMSELFSSDGQEFFISYEGVHDSFDAMGLPENLLRVIYAYGTVKRQP